MTNKIKFLQLAILVSVLFYACKKNLNEVDPVDTVDRSDLNDWTTATHSNDVEPNYSIVFPQESLNSLEITLTKTAWDSIKADMKINAGYDFGTRGTQGGAGIPRGGGVAGGGIPNGGIPGGGGGGGGGLDIVKGDPIWVESSVKFNGKKWYNVGFRLKGNSSLSGAWGSGNYKLPFKLQFDEFEEKYPKIKNQRFYGFKEFSMSPGYGDASLMRDKVVSDIFRSAGIPAARAAFYTIYINFGEGLKYCGVYTMLEVIDDTMVKDQFGEDKGNIYKPESNFTSFIQTQFEKKNNKTEANYSDVQSVITALNASNRTSDAATWRTNLEKVFDVDHFIKYLAINNTIVNWDAYGNMAHNYYLYTPKANNKVTWIPWDFNYSMSSSLGGGGVAPGGQPGGGGFGRGNSLEMTEVTANWPLINYIVKDATYYAKYKTYVDEFNSKYFQASRMNAIFDKEASLISAAAAQEVAPYSHLANYAAFTSAISSLKSHVSSRNSAVSIFLK